jgi:Arc/MetJ-type ribon-helix-helix transcriptional regulator
MSPQVAVRLGEELLEHIDAMVDTGRFETRADAIRAGIEELVDRERRREIGEAIVRGYWEHPQADDADDELGSFPTDAFRDG